MTRMHLLVERNLMVYRHTWSLLVAEVFEPVLYLLTIGIGIGTLVDGEHAHVGEDGLADVRFDPGDLFGFAVAAHPRQEVCAAGYEDGMVLLTRIDDGAEVLARAGAKSPVTALAWTAAGNRLAFGTEDGAAGVINF